MKQLKQASMTVEATLVLPIFLFAMLSVIYINKMLLYEEEVQWALIRTGKEISVEYAAIEGESDSIEGENVFIEEKNIFMKQKNIFQCVYAMAKMKKYMNGETTPNMLRSEFDTESGEFVLRADDVQTIPFPIICNKKFVFSEQYRTRAFVGVETRMTDEELADDIVYVTETGKVYHKNTECTYLKLSISQVTYEDIEAMRSESGNKYYACESCCKALTLSPGQKVYICNYGNRYHVNKTCTKIKRNIRQVKRSEAADKIPCSKCGKDEG